MKTFSLLSSSSDKASFRASLTVYSLVPAGVAYVRIRRADGTEAAGRKDDRGGATQRCDRRREAGLKRREAAMTAESNLRGIKSEREAIEGVRANAVLSAIDRWVESSILAWISEEI